ncbi:MAG: glycine dehydrogenase, partial [bacterium]|nr:glycine dehydrogenase [bacterium]
MAREYIPDPCLTELKPPSLLARPMSEMELREEMEELAEKNASNALCLIGAGSYRHFIPEAVNHATVYHHTLYSGYTPYQAEAAQGVLCALYETYRMLASLTGLPLITTHYDWASALAEAARMAVRLGHGKRTRILVSAGVNPLHLAVLRTSVELGAECTIETVPLHEHGMTDLGVLQSKLGDDVAAVIVQTPNFFGNIEPLLPSVAEMSHDAGALFIISQYAMSMGAMCPAEFGADVVVSDLQPFGIPVAFGGPSAGVIAAKKRFLREMPGRIVNKTVDKNGKPAYRLGYQAREQHIKREKATSNVCTNQNLMVLRAGAYLAIMGPENLRAIAEEHCY